MNQSNSQETQEKPASKNSDPAIHPPAANVPTQTQIYDNLRRIGELEDQKRAIQNEIDSRTVKLKAALEHVADDSLLFKMLSAALGKPSNRGSAQPTTTASTAKTRTTKKANKKTTSRKTKGSVTKRR